MFLCTPNLHERNIFYSLFLKMVLFLLWNAGNWKKSPTVQRPLQVQLCRCRHKWEVSALWLLLPVKPIFTTDFKMWRQLSKRTKPYLQISAEAPSKFSTEKKGPAHNCTPACAKSRLCKFLALQLQLNLLMDAAFLSRISKAEGMKGRQQAYFKLDISAEQIYRIIGKTCNKHITFIHTFWPKNYWLI